MCGTKTASNRRFSNTSKVFLQFRFDTRILNTMDTILNSISDVLGHAEVSAIDCARFIRNILDAKPVGSKLTDAQFISKVIENGVRHMRSTEMSFEEGFAIYYQSKQHLRHDSIRDIRCIGNRLLRANPELSKRNFSELTVLECETWLNSAFSTPPQQNKGRAMLHALFEFAIRRDWCDVNPIKRIERRKVVEREIVPLKTFPDKASDKKRPQGKSAMRRRRRHSHLYGNPPARSQPLALARHRHLRKRHNRAFAMLKDRRGAAGRNSARPEQALECGMPRIGGV